MRAAVQDRLTKAGLDLEAATKNRELGLHAWDVHMARQAVEFAPKAAWQAVRREPAPPHHRLRDLALGMGAEPPAQVSAALHQLAPHYTLTRYPDAGLGVPDFNYTDADAELAVRHAGELLTWARALVSESESPDT